MEVVPASFLFRFAIPVSRVDRLPRPKAPLLSLPETCNVPWPGDIDGAASPAQLAMAWNPEGLAVQVTVQGKSGPVQVDPDAIPSSDGFLLWIDTRDTQSQHRASRFCHLFAALPGGGGDSGDDPFVRQLPVPRAREDAPEAPADSFLAETVLLKDGYRLSVWFPREALHGYDPATQNRLGFMIHLLDTELGPHCFTVNADFPFDADPSLWVSLELTDAKA